jgi:hypothetical protein
MSIDIDVLQPQRQRRLALCCGGHDESRHQDVRRNEGDAEPDSS